MEITLRSTEGELNYVGENLRGQQIELSGSKEGVGPMESVLMAAAGCSSIDIELILQKMKQQLVSLEVKVIAERAVDEVPAVFTTIHLHYILKGKIKQEKAQKAVDVSVEKYCSVLKMLEKSVAITHTFEIIKDEI